MNPFTKGKVSSRTGNAALREADVRQIRRLGPTTPTRDLAEAYGVGMETVRKILRRDSWKWLAEEIDFEAPCGPLTAADRLAADASLARVQQMVQVPQVEAPGLAKLAQLATVEQAKFTRVTAALEELGGDAAMRAQELGARAMPRSPLDE